MKPLRRHQTVGIAALGLSALSGCGGIATDFEAIGQVEEQFTNQFPAPPGCLFCPPNHENITAEGLPFLKLDVRNLLGYLNAIFDGMNLRRADAHFDNCTFADSSRRIGQGYEDATADPFSFPDVLSCPTPLRGVCRVPSTGLDALRPLAGVLHALQDFYSHSNWTEIQASPHGAGLSVLLNDSIEEFPLLRSGDNLGGTIVTDNALSWGRLRPVNRGTTYPAAVLPSVCTSRATCFPALITGVADTLIKTHPNRCPANLNIFHDRDLAKDSAGSGRMFTQARALAVQQTTHEWCRYANLVYRRHGAGGTQSLCENWVGDAAAANHACPALPPEARCRTVLTFEGAGNGPDLVYGSHDPGGYAEFQRDGFIVDVVPSGASNLELHWHETDSSSNPKVPARAAEEAGVLWRDADAGQDPLVLSRTTTGSSFVLQSLDAAASLADDSTTTAVVLSGFLGGSPLGSVQLALSESYVTYSGAELGSLQGLELDRLEIVGLSSSAISYFVLDDIELIPN